MPIYLRPHSPKLNLSKDLNVIKQETAKNRKLFQLTLLDRLQNYHR